MTDRQTQARALGNPTRHAIFRHIGDVARPIGVAELNEAFPLNHNAIRQHLAKLVAAGLVDETIGTSTPAGGRPPLRYTLNPAATGHWDTTGAYERLSLLLVELLGSGLGAIEVGRRAADRFRAPNPTGSAVTDLQVAMARHGFEAESISTRAGSELVLHRCPFASTAAADRRTICGLHLGIADGLARTAGARVRELVAYEPHTARCRIRFEAERPGVPSDRGTVSVLTLRSGRRRA